MNQDTGSNDSPFSGDIPPPTEDTSSSMADDDLPF